MVIGGPAVVISHRRVQGGSRVDSGVFQLCPGESGCPDGGKCAPGPQTRRPHSHRAQWLEEVPCRMGDERCRDSSQAKEDPGASGTVEYYPLGKRAPGDREASGTWRPACRVQAHHCQDGEPGEGSHRVSGNRAWKGGSASMNTNTAIGKRDRPDQEWEQGRKWQV